MQYVGEALCTLMEVAGLVGDPGMVEPWATFLVTFRSSYAFGPLLLLETHSATDLISAFCTGCCGGVYLVTGRLDAAEEQLVRAVGRCRGQVCGRAACTRWQTWLRWSAPGPPGGGGGADHRLRGRPDCAPSAAAVDLALGRPGRAVDRLVAALDARGDARSPCRRGRSWSMLPWRPATPSSHRTPHSASRTSPPRRTRRFTVRTATTPPARSHSLEGRRGRPAAPLGGPGVRPVRRAPGSLPGPDGPGPVPGGEGPWPGGHRGPQRAAGVRPDGGHRRG